MENEDLKLKPYDRLQSIFSEKNTGKLTESGESYPNGEQSKQALPWPLAFVIYRGSEDFNKNFEPQTLFGNEM